jgi:hypothetical protein
MAVRSDCARSNYARSDCLQKKIKSFLQPPSCSGGLDVAPGAACGLGQLRGITGCLGGHMWPWGVAVGLWKSGVALGITDDLVGLQMASGAAGGLVGSWVAMGGPGWPLEVAVDLGRLRMTLIT